MDIKKVTSTLADDGSIGGTVFMDLLREANMINKMSAILGTDDPSLGINETIKTFCHTIAEMKGDEICDESQNARLDLLTLCFEHLLISFQNQKILVNLYNKMYAGTEEGKRIARLLETTFSDPEKAKNYIIEKGWAKEH